MNRPVVRWLAAALLVLAFVWQASLFIVSTSAAWDETIYLTAALDVFHHWRVDRLLTSSIAPLPVLLSYWLPAWSIRGDTVAAADFRQTIFLARLAHLTLVGLPLVLFPYFWLARRRGVAAGAVAGALMAFSPAIIAFSSLAVTDACFALTALVALCSLGWYAQCPSRTRLVAAGVALGLALAAKYTALFLFPVSLLVLLGLERPSASPLRATLIPRLVRTGFRTITLASIALVVAWALHGFALATPLPAANTWTAPPSLQGPLGRAVVPVGQTVLMPAPIRGAAGQMLHMRSGQPGFLAGRTSTRGWWYYFPFALAFKSTPAELMLAFALPALVWRRRRRLDATAVVLLTGLAVFVLCLPAARLNIGIRYALVLYPLVVMLAVDSAAAMAVGRGRAVAVAAVAIVLMQIASASAAAPRYLSYFNGVFTRAGEGHTRLVDSNVDWGQDLPALRETIAAKGGGRTVLAYFGSAPPDAYGVDHVAWDTADGQQVDQCRWLAVSATLMHGVYLKDDPFRRFRSLAADARVGDSMFLYDRQRSDVREAFAFARSTVDRQPCKPSAFRIGDRDPMAAVLGHWHLRCNPLSQ